MAAKGRGLHGLDEDLQSMNQQGGQGEPSPSNELAYSEVNTAGFLEDKCVEISRSDLVRVHADRLDGTNRISYVFKDGQLQVLLR
jgi:hypothetical protein